VTASYTYAEVLSTSERVAFRLEDVLPDQARFDFARPFLPDGLARVEAVPFMSPHERVILNQVRAHSYLATFGLVEEFILPFVLDHARADLSLADERTRALLQFAGEEAKHIDLFKRFRSRFEQGFGSPCEVVGPVAAVQKSVLARGPLAVALTILHIEWMTQRHYLESVQGEQKIDALFGGLLRQHFIEECQHAKLDTLMVLELSRGMTAREIDASILEYVDILENFDALIAQQVELDLRSFELKSARLLTMHEIEQLRRDQLTAARFTFLAAGLQHPRFRETVCAISDNAEVFLRGAALRFA
jgi:hypothetical protein